MGVDLFALHARSGAGASSAAGSRPSIGAAVSLPDGRRVELSDGVELFVRDLGSGEPLLLLHGFTGSGESWGSPLLHRLSAVCRVVAVDLPGHGRSGAPAEPSRYEISRVAHDLTRVLDVLGIPSATWAGYSMGGRIALAAAVRAPQRVSRLVLESASPGLATEEEQRGRREADEALANRIESDGIEAFVDFWEEQPLFATRKELDESVRDRQRQIRLANRPEALAACLRGLGTGRQPSLWPRLRDLEMPVLVLAGDRDRKFAGIGYRMGSAIPGGSFVLVPGAGHTVHLEQPEKWIGTILAFLQR